MAWIENVRGDDFVVQGHKFSEFLGRLGFVAQVLFWLKPHLAPLYAWAAVAGRSGKNNFRLPEMVAFTLGFIAHMLKAETYMLAAALPLRSPRQSFRTDAKCESGRVVLAGWETTETPNKARWFSLELSPQDAPYLFDAAGNAQWASTSAELLGSLAALHLFGHLSSPGTVAELPIRLRAGTDNQANEALSKHKSTTKFPLMFIHMQLSILIARARKALSLEWCPRDENELADALTNKVFKAFSAEKRIHVKYADLPLDLLHSLLRTKDQFLEAKKAHADAQGGPVKRRRKAKDKSAW